MPQTNAPDPIVGARFHDDATRAGQKEVPQWFMLPELFNVSPRDNFSAAILPELTVEVLHFAAQRLAALGSGAAKIASTAAASPKRRAFSAIIQCSAVG